MLGSRPYKGLDAPSP